MKKIFLVMMLVFLSYSSVYAVNVAVDNSFENNQWIESSIYQGEGIWHSVGFQRTTDQAYGGVWSASTDIEDTYAYLYQIVRGPSVDMIPTLSLSYFGLNVDCNNCRAGVVLYRLLSDPVIGESISVTGTPSGGQGFDWFAPGSSWNTHSETFSEGYGSSWYMVQVSGRNTAIDNVNIDIVPVVVPEPISSTLFIVGGATLGFRRFRKKFKK